MSAGVSVCAVLDRPTPRPEQGHLSPFRPIQYLGNKLRVLDRIAEAAESLVDGPGRVLDLFSGTSVVSQCLASRGFSVTASDTQEYARIFASALLGIGRDAEICPGQKIIESARQALTESLFETLRPYAAQECALLSPANAGELLALYERLPLAWRDPKHPAHALVRDGDEASAFERLPLISAMYAGSYFGVAQALMIDALRLAIFRLASSGDLTGWQSDAALTALMSAASAAVHSAGKHFAQPLTAGSGANIRFRTKRLLEDRSVDIERTFLFASEAINRKAPQVSSGHRALKMAAEEVVTEHRAALHYIDPPYTAQQYSRFYHILETLADYKIRGILHNGSLTTGLYPEQRYKSAFSSKTAAPRAFGALLEAAKETNAAVIISYSQSETGSDGNARMITLNELLSMCSRYFGESRVVTSEMDHRYRQFNSASYSNSKRSDPEILIMCRSK